MTPSAHEQPAPPLNLSKSPAAIAGMFDAIARRYDLLNRVLSAGVDRQWRQRAVRSLALTGRERVLDVCTGTADLAIAAATARPAPRQVIGIDFAGAMLRIGNTKVQRRGLASQVSIVQGDATCVPLASGSVEAVTIAFGIRNVEDAGLACREMSRVLTPGGRLAVLEFAIPTTPGIRHAYLWYFDQVLPRIGRLVSKHQAAYDYLPASVRGFASPDEFVQTLSRSGFTDIKAEPLTFGIVYLFTARRRV